MEQRETCQSNHYTCETTNTTCYKKTNKEKQELNQINRTVLTEKPKETSKCKKTAKTTPMALSSVLSLYALPFTDYNNKYCSLKLLFRLLSCAG